MVPEVRCCCVLARMGAFQSEIHVVIRLKHYKKYECVKAANNSLTLCPLGFLIDKMSDYGTGFLMAGVALIVSALFLLLLHQMNRQSQRSTTLNHDMHTDKIGQSVKAEAKELDMT